MKEVEAKVLEMNVKELEKRLKKIGARKTFEGGMRALYFDYSGEPLKKAGIVLRLRKENSTGRLTIKANITREKVKTADETEVMCNFNKTLKELTAAGLKVFKEVKKHRTEYLNGKFHYEIDKLPGIPAYLEVEAENASGVMKALKLLGIKAKDAKAWTTGDVVKYYNKK